MQLNDFVNTNLAAAAAAESQKKYYNSSSKERSFQAGDLVWLSDPTAKKLDPRWTGGWRVTKLKGPVMVEITNSQQARVVHINQLRRRIQPNHQPTVPQTTTDWIAPQIDHESAMESPEAQDAPHRYPQRNRQLA